MIRLEAGNCFNVHPTIPDKSVSLVFIDPPFGQTPLHWDKTVSFKDLWTDYKRILKDDGVVCIFGQEPFSSFVRMSNLADYKYDFYWEKERLTNVFQVKRRPGKTIETISVFYKNQGQYFPQKTVHEGKPVSNKIGTNNSFSVTQQGNTRKVKPVEYIDDGERHPTQVLRFRRDNLRNNLHPTQKPLALVENIIKTFTKEGDLVLDSFMGSGRVPIACSAVNRDCIGIDNGVCEVKKSKYYKWSWKNTVQDLLDNTVKEV